MYIYTINAIAMQSRCSDSFWYLEEQSVLTVVRKSLNDRLDHYLLTTKLPYSGSGGCWARMGGKDWVDLAEPEIQSQSGG